MAQPITDKQPQEKHLGYADEDGARASSDLDVGPGEEQIFSLASVDPVLDAKMRLVNNVCCPKILITRGINLTGRCRRWTKLGGPTCMSSCSV